MRLTGGVLKLEFEGDTLADGNFRWCTFEPDNLHCVGIAKPHQFLCARITRLDQRSQGTLEYPLAFGTDLANGPFVDPIAEYVGVVFGDVVEIVGDGFADVIGFVVEELFQ